MSKQVQCFGAYISAFIGAFIAMPLYAEAFTSDVAIQSTDPDLIFSDTDTGGITGDWYLEGDDDAFKISHGTASSDEAVKIFNGAPQDSMVITSAGRLGLGTSTPVTDVQIVNGNTPTVRFEQDGSSGFTPQTWDILSNEANFAVRDVTGGSQLPFRIQPGADTNSLYIASDDDIGMGTASPDSSLHVYRADGTARVVVEEDSNTRDARTLLSWINKGPVAMTMENTDLSETWFFMNHDTGFRIGTFDNQNLFRLEHDGDLIIAGILDQNSDVHAKKDIHAVDGHSILAALENLPISEWTYKTDRQGSRHLGPMAQDFHAAFGLGQDETKLAPGDMAGISLAAVKAQQEEIKSLKLANTEKDAEIAQLRAELRQTIEALKVRLDAVEAANPLVQASIRK